MANEITFTYPSGSDLDVRVREADGDVWYLVGAAFEAWGTSSRTAVDYVTAMTDKEGGMYVADFPSAIPAGYYIVQVSKRSGAPAADGDSVVGGTQLRYWDGTTLYGDPVTVTRLSTGIGAIEWDYTILNDSGLPIEGVTVWVTTDVAGSNVVQQGNTDNFGVVTMYLDAGTYYFWRKKSNYNFSNPDTEVVS